MLPLWNDSRSGCKRDSSGTEYHRLLSSAVLHLHDGSWVPVFVLTSPEDDGTPAYLEAEPPPSLLQTKTTQGPSLQQLRQLGSFGRHNTDLVNSTCNLASYLDASWSRKAVKLEPFNLQASDASTRHHSW